MSILASKPHTHVCAHARMYILYTHYTYCTHTYSCIACGKESTRIFGLCKPSCTVGIHFTANQELFYWFIIQYANAV